MTHIVSMMKDAQAIFVDAQLPSIQIRTYDLIELTNRFSVPRV